ncbi:nuclear pore complex protein Nup153 isoform X2 [Danaus plexippus]|uniref:nuclear pore complex protein Nup153 isoform X2 n=1 Tax=Danaus plexippus TaxID=13037 RepID=UPI002AB055E4|nr:nuclear pore complex protein Nup153 isoform X2 [Danaus plexippus]
MSASLSSRKAKRSRTDSEANDSFVKNVTSRMSGLLPATITRWFSSSSSSNTNGSTVVESTDSSTEDEATDGLRTPNQRNQPSQPPAKRMRIGTPGTSSYYYPETKSTSTNTETTETYSTLQSPIKDTLKVETNYVSTPSCSPSETSTINENEKDPSIYIYQDSITSVNNSVEQTRKSIFGSEERLQESCARTAANTYKDLTQPYFKPGLLCTPFYTSRPVYGGTRNVYVNRPNIKHKTNPLVNKVDNNSSVNISNSAKRIMDLLENYSSPVSEARRISRLVNSSCDKTPDTSLNTSIDANNSKAASYKKRELYVPSFASILQLKQKARLNETTSAARQIIASHSSSLNTLPYPASTSGISQTKEHSQENLTTKMKTRVTRLNRGEDKESESNKLPIVELPTAVLQIDKDNLPKFSLDTPVSHSSDNKQKNPESVLTGTNSVAQVPKVVLSKNEAPKSRLTDMLDGETYTFSSPIRISEDNFITSTETYKFGSPERSVEPSKNNNKIVSSSDDIEEDEEDIGIQSHQSDEILKTSTSQSCVSLEAAKSPMERPIFNKCLECKVVASQLSSDKCFDCEKKVNSTGKMDSKLSKSTSSTWKCQDCWVNNDVGVEKCVCCGAKNSSASQNSPAPKVSSEIPKTTWKCQDCWVNNEGTDKCVCCGAKQSIAPKMLSKLQPQKPVNTWKCEECWVDNNYGADKCICCGTKNSSTTKTEQNTNSETSDWKCGVCWLKNKSHDDKCVACSGPKPAAKEQNQNKISSPSPNANNNNSLLKNIVKSQSNKWECPSCFVHNDNNISKCVCCETEKPGITKESEKKSFNFGVSPNVSFKFGINPKQTTTESEPKPASIFGQATQEMETNNNHISKAPSFTFGIQNKKPEKEVSKEDNKIVETPKVAFTFGIPKDNSTPNSAPAFKINTDMFKPTTQSSVTNISSANDSERAQEVPSVDQSQLRGVESAPKLTGLFGASPSKDSTLNKSITNALTPFNSNFTAESSANPTLTTASNTLGTSNASFSMTGNQPSKNLFTTSIAPTSANAFASVQTPPVTSSVSMFQKNEQASPLMSFFQKSENTSLSMFNKNEPTATTTSVSVLPSAPVFSFGTSTPTTAPSNEKSGFTFTFGRDSKNETPSMFKLPFGGTPDNSASNKFMMPSSNINSSNMLPASNLAGNSVGNNMPLMLSGGNNNPLGGLSTGNGLPSGNLMNNLTQNQLSMASNVITNNAPAASGDIFNTPVQKENMWSTGNNNTQGSMFGSSEASNNSQKRPFAFGASSGTSKPFSPVGSSPFDNPNQPRPLFGITNQPAANPFGSAASPMAPNMFSSQPSNPAPSVGMFGNTNAPGSQPPAFGFPVSSFSSFDSNNMNQPMNPNPTPAFNFGAPQQPSGVFGFGQQQQPQLQQQQQQQQQQPPQQQGVYNFGGGAPQVQFTVGSAPNTAGRRVRRAFRRTQR